MSVVSFVNNALLTFSIKSTMLVTTHISIHSKS